jgi:hypothetical protein
VRDHDGQQFAYVYFENEPRSAAKYAGGSDVRFWG